MEEREPIRRRPRPLNETAVGRLTEALTADERVIFAYLFGSYATGEAIGSRSDVDVGVYVTEPADFDTRLRFIGIATTALKRDDVDLLLVNTAPLTLAFEILKGRLLVCKDEGERVEAEAMIMSRYHDRVYHMRRHLDLAMKRIRERGFS